MLQPPSLVYSSRDMLLPEPNEVWCVEHSNLNTIRSMFGNKGCQKGCARLLWGFTSTPKCIRKNRYLQIRVASKTLIESLQELIFSLPNVQGRKINSFLCIPYFILQLRLAKTLSCV